MWLASACEEASLRVESRQARGCRCISLQRRVGALTPHHTSVTACQYSSDGRSIVTCAAELNPVRVVDAATLATRDTVVEGVAPWGNVVLKPCVLGNG